MGRLQHRIAILVVAALVAACSPKLSSEAASAPDHPSPATDATMNSGGRLLQLFLMFGQSKLEGVPTPSGEDLAENDRVLVLGYDTCNGRSWNHWDIAAPPLHRCWTGLGPGDYFGKTLAEAWPEESIGLVPSLQKVWTPRTKYHFSAAAQRQLGHRFARAMLDALE